MDSRKTQKQRHDFVYFLFLVMCICLQINYFTFSFFLLLLCKQSYWSLVLNQWNHDWIWRVINIVTDRFNDCWDCAFTPWAMKCESFFTYMKDSTYVKRKWVCRSVCSNLAAKGMICANFPFISSRFHIHFSLPYLWNVILCQ